MEICVTRPLLFICISLPDNFLFRTVRAGLLYRSRTGNNRTYQSVYGSSNKRNHDSRTWLTTRTVSPAMLTVPHTAVPSAVSWFMIVSSEITLNSVSNLERARRESSFLSADNIAMKGARASNHGTAFVFGRVLEVAIGRLQT